MRVKITPKKLSGTIDIIPSKSCLHRAILAASLSNGTSIIQNIIYSEDVIATIDACISLGAIITKTKNTLEIKGVTSFKKNQIINCNQSGSTLRFIIPILITQENEVTLIGDKSLFKRPLDIYFEIFKKQNIKYEFNDKLFINGVLNPDEFIVDGGVSSQFITGLLFALPLLNNDSKIIIKNDLESKGYVDITIDILKKFNIDIINNNYKEFIIKGKQKFISCDYIAESDYSQASFFLVANELGNDIKINNLNNKSLQPDKKIIEDIKKIKQNQNVDLSENPDCGPILSVLASLYNLSFVNAKRLRIKECDRLNAIVVSMNKLGALLTEDSDEIHFVKVDKLKGDILLDCFDDHRIAMSLAIASTICDKEIILDKANCVNKSYPNFWEDFKMLGGIINVE